MPVYLALDLIGVSGELGLPMLKVAADAGFVVLNLYDVYGPTSSHDALRSAPWDQHPNAVAHGLIAERLLQEFRRHPTLLTPRGNATSIATTRRSDP